MIMSVVVVNWNTVGLLQDCLLSVFKNYQENDMEVIVVDNASEDESVEMLESEFPQVTLIKNHQNVGFAAANNQAFLIAKGKYYLLLNSDTVIHGDVLQKSVDYLEKHGDVGAMGCRVLNSDGSLQITCSQFPTLLNLLLLTSGLWKLKWFRFFDRYQMNYWDRTDEREVDVISGCYMLVRQEAIDKVGLLDENFFFFGEETDWCRRFQAGGWQLRFAPVGEITHYGGGSVKKLNHIRDVMLTGATVRLHRKHFGHFSALTVWFVLFAFHASRLLFWSLTSILMRTDDSKARAQHFRKVIRMTPDTWE